MPYFDPEAWRLATPAEIHHDLVEKRERREQKQQAQDQEQEMRGSGHNALVLRQTISPFDAYTYLKARFGEPNGLMTRLATDDSDNLYHWDYAIVAGDHRLTFVGATQEVHVWTDQTLSDAQWLRFIEVLRQDFGRVAHDKGRVAGNLEKWHIFPNRFLAIANHCAEVFYRLSETLPLLEHALRKDDARPSDPDFKRRAQRQARLTTKVVVGALELPLLTPILFECFLGLLVGLFVKPEIKADPKRFEAFQRGRLTDKILTLADHCDGFDRPLRKDNETLRRFWPVVARRNDLIHGNLDPVRDAVEIVYFDGKRPLYTAGADRHDAHWNSLVSQYAPARAIDDYLAMHAAIHEILQHLSPVYRRTLEVVMADTEPGWDARRRKIGKLFPGYLIQTSYPDLRYDTDLTVADEAGS